MHTSSLFLMHACTYTQTHTHTQTFTHTQTLIYRHKHTHTHTHMHSHIIWGLHADWAKTGYCHANIWVYVSVCMHTGVPQDVCHVLGSHAPQLISCMYYRDVCHYVLGSHAPQLISCQDQISVLHTFFPTRSPVLINSMLFFTVSFCCFFCVQEREQEEEEAIAQSDEPVVSAASIVCGVLNLNTAWICCGSVWMFKVKVQGF